MLLFSQRNCTCHSLNPTIIGMRPSHSPYPTTVDGRTNDCSGCVVNIRLQDSSKNTWLMKNDSIIIPRTIPIIAIYILSLCGAPTLKSATPPIFPQRLYWSLMKNNRSTVKTIPNVFHPQFNWIISGKRKMLDQDLFGTKVAQRDLYDLHHLSWLFPCSWWRSYRSL